MTKKNHFNRPLSKLYGCGKWVGWLGARILGVARCHSSSMRRAASRFARKSEFRKRSNALPLFFMVAILQGCDGDLDELKRYVRSVQKTPPANELVGSVLESSGPQGGIPMLHVVQPPASLAKASFERGLFQSPTHTRDPFKLASSHRLSFPMEESNLKKRRKEPLEAFPLIQLRMVGLLNKQKKQWGLIALPDGSLFPVQVGNYIGQHEGKVMSITPTSILIQENRLVGHLWDSHLVKLLLV